MLGIPRTYFSMIVLPIPCCLVGKKLVVQSFFKGKRARRKMPFWLGLLQGGHCFFELYVKNAEA